MIAVFDDCPKCAKKVSTQEKELLNFVESVLSSNPEVKVIANSRSVIPPKELDIFIPALSLAFEYNGEYWHDWEDYCKDLETRPKILEDCVSAEYGKTLSCSKIGVALHHVWSSQWLKNREEAEAEVKRVLASALKNRFERS